MKLFKVKLKGLYDTTGKAQVNSSYVVAENCHEAYLKVRKWLDEQSYGYGYEREMKEIELLAETDKDTFAGTILFL